MQRYIRSVYWLVGCTGVGYILLKLTAPADYKIPHLRQATQQQFTSEQNRQANLFMERLKEKTPSK